MFIETGQWHELVNMHRPELCANGNLCTGIDKCAFGGCRRLHESASCTTTKQVSRGWIKK